MDRESENRLNEILDVAQRLFVIKGYAHTTINDILKEVGIARGTFYYYFESKEAVLDAVIDRIAKQAVLKATEVVKNDSLTPDQKLLFLFLSVRVVDEIDESLMAELHNPENALMHQKSLSSMITHILPLLLEIVEEGIEQGIFHCQYPKEYMQIFMVSAVTLLDDGIFQHESDEKTAIFRALIALLEQMLGVENDRFWNLAQKYWR